MLDLHGGTGSRRKLAQGLARTLDGNRSIPCPNHETNQQLVENRRERLNGYAEAIHAMRDPWGVSVYGARAAVMGIEPAAHTTLRFRGEALRGLHSESYRKAREDLRSYVAKGGLTLVRSGQPWSKSTIHSSDQANGAWGSLVSRSRNPSECFAHAGCGSDTKPRKAGRDRGRLGRAWRSGNRLPARTRSSTRVSTRRISITRPVPMPLAEGTARRATQTIASGDFRRARKTVRDHLREGKKLSSAELYQHITAAKAIRDAWAKVGDPPGIPQMPSDLAARGGPV